MSTVSPLINPLAPQIALSREEVAAQNIRREIRQAALNLNNSYLRLMNLVYKPPGTTKEKVTALFSENELVGLRKQACVVKGILNFLNPNTIDDIVPAATITLPEELFPEYAKG